MFYNFSLKKNTKIHAKNRTEEQFSNKSIRLGILTFSTSKTLLCETNDNILRSLEFIKIQF